MPTNLFLAAKTQRNGLPFMLTGSGTNGFIPSDSCGLPLKSAFLTIEAVADSELLVAVIILDLLDIHAPGLFLTGIVTQKPWEGQPLGRLVGTSAGATHGLEFGGGGARVGKFVVCCW